MAIVYRHLKPNGEIYDSIKDLSKILNIKYTTLRAKLVGQNKNNTIYRLMEEGGYYYTF